MKNAKLAVIQTGGKQYIVKPGDVLKIEKIKTAKVGEKIEFDKVLLIADDKNIQIGEPLIEGAKISAKIEEEGKDKKITILKYKNKTRYKIKKGHRQPFTKVSIKTIF